MALVFTPIDLATGFAEAYAMRRDSYVVSFGDAAEFDCDAGVDGGLYRAKLASRGAAYPGGYLHVWLGEECIGQIEARHEPDLPGQGYVHLFYLKDAYRHRGLGGQLHDVVLAYLRSHGCRTARLSVDRDNVPALAFYRKHGWVYDGPNPKHPSTDFMRLDLLIQPIAPESYHD